MAFEGLLRRLLLFNVFGPQQASTHFSLLGCSLLHSFPYCYHSHHHPLVHAGTNPHQLVGFVNYVLMKTKLMQRNRYPVYDFEIGAITTCRVFNNVLAFKILTGLNIAGDLLSIARLASAYTVSEFG